MRHQVDEAVRMFLAGYGPERWSAAPAATQQARLAQVQEVTGREFGIGDPQPAGRDLRIEIARHQVDEAVRMFLAGYGPERWSAAPAATVLASLRPRRYRSAPADVDEALAIDAHVRVWSAEALPELRAAG
jgi:hypothetical protein